LFFEDGAPPASAAFDVAPTSRFNIYPPVDFASSVEAITRRRFGVRVESLPGPGALPAAEIVVERAMYSSDGVHAWAAGSNALATPCP